LRPLNLEDRFHDFGVEAKEYELGMALELWDLPPETREPGRAYGSACDVRIGIDGLRRRLCWELGTARPSSIWVLPGMYTRLGFNACCNFVEFARAEIDSLPARFGS
jgi:hypothetical protein